MTGVIAVSVVQEMILREGRKGLKDPLDEDMVVQMTWKLLVEEIGTENETPGGETSQETNWRVPLEKSEIEILDDEVIFRTTRSL
mmetsp:Transcript_32378/g.53538  ORF Transcript_32378/g.53538 Transcript_32378/m.53538 type:complete len:85 (+) Transcript_32378:293-547(+)